MLVRKENSLTHAATHYANKCKQQHANKCKQQHNIAKHQDPMLPGNPKVHNLKHSPKNDMLQLFSSPEFTSTVHKLWRKLL